MTLFAYKPSLWIHMLLGASLVWAACGRSASPENHEAPRPSSAIPLSDKQPIADVVFDRPELDLGKIKLGTKELHVVYPFTNKGPSALRITKVSTSEPCVCDYPTDSVVAGTRDSVVMHCLYSGIGVVRKTIFIYTQNEPVQYILQLRAEIVE